VLAVNQDSPHRKNSVKLGENDLCVFQKGTLLKFTHYALPEQQQKRQSGQCSNAMGWVSQRFVYETGCADGAVAAC